MDGSTPEFDMYGAMDWKDGVGTLPGSQLKFRVNEFGVLEVITDVGEEEGVKKAHATTTWSVPTAQEALSVEVHCGRVSVCSNRKDSATHFLPDGHHCTNGCLHPEQQEKSKSVKEDSRMNGEVTRVSRRRPHPAKRAEEELDEMTEVVEEDNEDNEEKDGRRLVRGGPRGRRKRRGDAALLRQPVSYGGRKKSWCWASYLEQEKALAAPSKLFKEHQSFPQSKSGFRVGMRLEGIDPLHPSMYCVLSVAEVSGYRMRLHFDGYSDCYDFWVNCDSTDTHPVGWCEKTGHKLHPPKGMKSEAFSWCSYLKTNKLQAAPKSLFHNHNATVTPLGFRVGMKLEAVDKKKPSLVRVSTVRDMVESRLLVHFDSWDESYDYWCDVMSPYIHPVGWCRENSRTLTTPPGYADAENFSWERYLEETSSFPAPARSFKAKPPHSFQVNMKLEAVDVRNPVMVRVATVVDRDEHRVKIHFDGWTEEYDYWLDADSPDIHPAGWCAKTGHALQPPISLEDTSESEQGGCPTPGCRGIGHIKGARYSGHHSAMGCPYSEINMKKDSVLPDRLSGEMPGSGVGRPRRVEQSPDRAAHSLDKPVRHLDKADTATIAMETTHQKPVGTESKRRVGRPCKVKRVEEPPQEEEVESEESSIAESKELTLQQVLHQSVFMPCSAPSPSMPHCWDQHSKLLPSVAGITASRVATWSVEQVTEFIQGLPGCKEQVHTFKEEQIDGEAFLLLTQTDLVKILSMKLGPALKIFNSILMFKTAEKSACNEL
ncbi:lethal(3)malignant brain tumor-like protein 3 isoform X1 [Ictalurus furcatus]|uniref:lethal(3)malignant brain tumor-like protein 3 isoform X1 n=1 Tax=Ictalurus furcatus TaxID=66913 RepID=UPI00234FE3A9|nr:lethal(3)malignant brain tumor-like protein 3 isoform X1 [Ictalurus furcatus]XP_053497905.1 lethal(3)malignant brain tumor-like protein 3 isoform X1 [Ictalurus furcatus]